MLNHNQSRMNKLTNEFHGLSINSRLEIDWNYIEDIFNEMSNSGIEIVFNGSNISIKS